MTCGPCGKSNLPGGVRCVYCGAPFPPAPDFELDLPQAEPAAATPGPADGPGTPASGKNALRPGLWSGLLILALKAKSLLALLKLGPLLLTFGSMLVFIRAEAMLWGWKLAAGFAVSILVHELGHVVMNRRHGLKCSAPMFIPFAGAVITVKQFPDDPTVESECGAGGPAAGLLAALVCVLLGVLTGQHYWTTLAFLGFAVNFFNLIPFWQLDGARIFSAISPGNWDFVLVTLLLVVLKAPSTLLWILLVVLFLLRLGRHGPGRYNLATPLARARMALLYLALCLTLGYGVDRTREASPYSQVRATAAARQGAATARPSAAAPAPRRTVPSRLADPALAQTVQWVLRGVLSVAAALGWLIVSLLLASAAGVRRGSRGADLAAWMVPGLLLFFGVSSWVGSPGQAWLVVGAYFAALLGALVFSGYQAAHAPVKAARPPHDWLTWRCLAWAAGAALVVAYWSGSVWVLAAIALAVGLFYARRPWLLLSLGARGVESLGLLDAGSLLRRRALALHPEPPHALDLYYRTARTFIAQERGADALETLEQARVDGLEATPGTMQALLLLVCRSQALIRLDRFDEALACCEAMLQAPPADPLGPWRPVMVHAVLAEMALYRSWPDEARAQADSVLRRISKNAAGLAAAVAALGYRVRAAAWLDSGDASRARADWEKSQLLGREPAAEGAVALLKARASLINGDTAAADRDSESARRRLPGSLESRYWRALVLRSAGRESEGRTMLDELASAFPGEHWGARARGALQAS